MKYDYLDGKAINSLKHCLFCPKECHADRTRGARGFCRTDAGINIASISVHKGEEPAISGVDGICNIFFSGCNLRCLYCQNYEISRGDVGSCSGEDMGMKDSNAPAGQTVSYSFEGAVKTVESILNNGINSIGFVSPSHMVPHLVAFIRTLRSRGYNPVTVYNTNGYDKVSTLKNLEGLIDVYLPDFKYASPGVAGRFSGAYDYPGIALAAIKEMYRQKGSTLITDDKETVLSGLIIRHLVLPGHVEESKKVLRLLAGELSTGIHLSLMSQYFPTKEVTGHPSLNRILSGEEYDDVVMEMDRLGFRNGWLQEMESYKTYRPDFSKEDPFNR